MSAPVRPRLLLPAALSAAAGLAAAAAFAPDPLPARQSGGGPGPFAVAGGAVPVLLETGTGQTWALARVGPGEHAWLPCERVTDPDRAAELRTRVSADASADAAPPGDQNASAPAGGAYFPGDLLGGDLIGGDLIGGSLVGGNAIDGDLVGGNVVGRDLLEGRLMDADETGAGDAGAGDAGDAKSGADGGGN